MGSKGKNNAKSGSSKGPPPIIQKDLLQRLHFSQQPNVQMAKATTDPRQDVLTSLAMAQMRGTKRMAVHNQLKLDPSFKRTICPSCHSVLVPGLTSRVRNRPNRNHIHVTHHTCLQCSHVLSLPCPPTSPPGNELDGPSRSKRHHKAAKRTKVVSFEREVEGGHELWQGQTKVEGWGQRHARTLNHEKDSKDTG